MKLHADTNRRRLKPPFPAKIVVSQLTGNGGFIRRQVPGKLADARENDILRFT